MRDIPTWLKVSAILLFIGLGLFLRGCERRHAMDLVERDGVPVASFHQVAWACNGMKGRVGYRFTTESGRRGKICIGAGVPYRITYDR